MTGTQEAATSADALDAALAASIPRLDTAPVPFRVLDEHGALQGPDPGLSDEQLRQLYSWMLLGRLLDERGLQLQRQGRVGVWGPMLGQEAAQAGLGLAMGADDWIFPSYREAITLLMRGLEIWELLAYYRGLYWLADPSRTGVFPMQIVIGDQALHAIGAGLGFALRGQRRVAIGVVGDGATSQGDFLEALNFSGVFAPQSVIFVQNNQWAISVPRAHQTASQTLAQKALAFGITGLLLDGNDALAVWSGARWALERARAGAGPVLIEALTYRLGAHTTADDPRRYQPPDEIEVWRQRDPLPRLRAYLEHRSVWDDAAEAAAREDALGRIDAAIARAEAEPVPPLERYERACHG